MGVVFYPPPPLLFVAAANKHKRGMLSSMPEELLRTAREQADKSNAGVRAAALLHIARVLTAFDQAEAERALETGIVLAEALEKKGGRCSKLPNYFSGGGFGG